MFSPTIAAAKSGGGGSFLVSPSLGLMIWTLIAFLGTMFVLRRFALPKIQEALDKRQKAIEDSIDASERTRVEADKLLAEYRERLKDARQQAEEIVTRARHAGDVHEQESQAEAKRKREEMMEDTRRDIQQETKRAIQLIRSEVADLTVMATEKVTRKTLDSDDQRRLVEEALGELDFESLAGSSSGSREGK